jgi:restriction system protein
MKNNPTELPTWDEFLRPLLECAAAGPILRRTAIIKIADQYHFSDEIRSSRVKSGQTHIDNRSGWAMSSLLKANLISKHPAEKFTYQITESGRSFLEKQSGPISIHDLRNIEGYEEAWKAASQARKVDALDVTSISSIDTSTPSDLIEKAVEEIQSNLRSELLAQMAKMNPYDFEQLVIDLLFAMGYGGSREEAAKVTKKSNDEGIDGVINEDRLGLDVIYVQAKRWQGNVGRKEIQSFVGALAGQQANKGVFITTSDFVQNAHDYAKSVNQKVILINGARLADLMIEHDIGVSTTRTIALKRIDTDYFEES